MAWLPSHNEFTWNSDSLSTAFLESHHWKHARHWWCVDKPSVGSLKETTTHSQLPSKADSKESDEATICIPVYEMHGQDLRMHEYRLSWHISY